MSSANAVDLAEKTLDAVNDAARMTRNVYITFLLLGAYIGVGVASTTDEQLLRESAVTLPLLDVSVPITGFYRFIPWALILFHLNLLLQFAMLAHKVRFFAEQARKAGPEHERALKARLFSFPFVQILIPRENSRIMRLVQSLMVWIAIIVLPLGLLLWVQLGFLPFHDSQVLWEHRAAIWIDAILLIVFWSTVESERTGQWLFGWRNMGATVGTVIVTITGLIAIGGSLAMDATPAERPTQGLGLASMIDNTLEITGKVLTANQLPADLISALEAETDVTPEMLKPVLGLNLERRDLRSAEFSKSLLPKANLHYAQLHGVGLLGAKLPRAVLSQAELPGARLVGAHLQNADLQGAQLQGATLSNAQLQGAILNVAVLSGAQLSDADLTSAHLVDAELDNANLVQATLRDASLSGAILTGADLRDAELHGAKMSERGPKGCPASGCPVD